MNIAVLGSGAMGCLYGGKLAEAGLDVTLIDVWKEHVDTINRDGLKIEGIGGTRIIRNVRAITNPADLGTVDLIIVFVKATLTKQAMEGARSLVGPDTKVFTLQNGLGNVEKLSEVIGRERLIAGTTAHGSTLLGPGHIRHAGEGDTVIGNVSCGVDENLKGIAEFFEKAGFPVKLSENVMGLIWGKLIVNIGINALTAITGLKNGRLVEIPETEELLEKAVREALNVAERKGISLQDSDPLRHTKEVCRLTAANRSSMLQDVSNGRMTEIDVINGAIADEGDRLGISTPVNSILASLIRVRQKTYDEI